MQLSEARIAANRRNALRSTGPKTEEGKAASRGNAFKHGLTGEGVVIPEGDAAEVARRAEGLAAELAPAGLLGRVLVDRMALLSVRMERCAALEIAATEGRVRHATEDFDARRVAEVDAAFAALADEPAAGHRRLLGMPEGVDRLVGAWASLAIELIDPRPSAWDAARAGWLEALLGLASGPGVPRTRVGALARAVGGDFAGLEPGEADGPTPDARRDRARRELAAEIGVEVERLRDHRATLDLEAIALDRAAAPTLALFDPSAEAGRLRRYEAAAERGFFRSLRELRAIEPPPAARGSETDRLGSFRPADRPAPEPRDQAVPPPSAPTPAVIRTAPAPVPAGDLDRPGRVAARENHPRKSRPSLERNRR